MAQRNRVWGFDDAEREILIEGTAETPALRALVERAQRRADLQGLWIVKASVEELDEMYTLVEALTDATRSRKRRDQLDGLRATLCTAMDGF